MTAKQKVTRFRAYQLGSAGSSFSYFNGESFTLIEARYCDGNRGSIHQELETCGHHGIHTLHITSWDQDHCSPGQLAAIIEELSPRKIEYPGYHPHTQAGMDSLAIIKRYKAQSARSAKIVQVTPEYIASLEDATNFGYRDILYHPKFLDRDCANNNSTIKQFRSGSFNVLSLGDVESTHIAAGLRSYKTVYDEVDVLILAHHGADNGFTTSSFLRTVRPTIAIASADYANHFEHPKQEIRDLLHKYEIPLFTTKTGDVAIFSTSGHAGHFRLVNLMSGNTAISSQYDFYAKKSRFLNQNSDVLRVRSSKPNRGPKR